MNFRLCLLMAFFLVSSAVLAAEISGPTPDTSLTVSDTPTSEPTDQPTVEPTPQPTPTKPDYSNNPDPSKALVIHKPKPSPAWGKVIQYHREKVLALSDQDSETLHEFVFQDDNGIIRTAIYHENESGDGYWEVWVWDQP
jgi:hypothetical protein